MRTRLNNCGVSALTVWVSRRLLYSASAVKLSPLMDRSFTGVIAWSNTLVGEETEKEGMENQIVARK